MHTLVQQRWVCWPGLWSEESASADAFRFQRHLSFALEILWVVDWSRCCHSSPRLWQAPLTDLVRCEGATVSANSASSQSHHSNYSWPLRSQTPARRAPDSRSKLKNTSHVVQLNTTSIIMVKSRAWSIIQLCSPEAAHGERRVSFVPLAT